MKHSRFSRRRRCARSAVLLLAGAVSMFGPAQARELLPFPSQQMQTQAQPRAPNLDDFRRTVTAMNCGQLQSLRSKLVSTQQSASTGDKNYYLQLIIIVDQRRGVQHCAP